MVEPDNEAPVVATATVVGAGVMGAAIAQVLATAGVEVTCVDRSETQLKTAERLVRTGRYGLDQAVERGKLDAAAAREAVARLAFTTDLAEGVAHAELVIEAVPEDLAIKLDVFGQLGELTEPGTILASNTSGLPVVALAASARRHEVVLAWHWASPAQVSRFAEIAVTPRTDADTTARVVALAHRCGKQPVVITENPRTWGFVANRVFFAAVREAERVRDEGLATEAEIDALMRAAYAWPSGPFGVVRGATEGWGDQREGSVATLLCKSHEPSDQT